MKEFYFTFGGYNSPELKGKCVKIIADDSEIARNIMFNNFLSYWGFEYNYKPVEELIDLNIAINISDNFLKLNNKK